MALYKLYHHISLHEWVNIPTGWARGGSVYTGLIAALLLHKAISSLANVQQALISASVTFLGAVEARQAWLTVEFLKQEATLTSIEVRLWQDEEVQSILVASFAQHRNSSLDLPPRITVPDYAAVEDLEQISNADLRSECAQQFELRWAEKNWPFTASQRPDFGGWCRFAPLLHQNRDMQLSDLMALFDIWPAGVLPMLQHKAASHSLSWHVNYIQPLQTQLQDWMKYQVVSDVAQDGYATEQAYLWDRDARLIAIARQTVSIFA